MTRTEELVFKLCNKTFLSLWSYPNPIGKKRKELCDVLVVCEPDIIIFSIKEINIKESGDLQTDVYRWLTRAIDASVNQIYGAERFLESAERFTLSNFSEEIELPIVSKRKIHRVAVSFGRGNKFPLKYGDLGKGFVHVFDERSVQIILNELDTIKDFLDYLNAKEELIKSCRIPLTFGEEDMLAYYLSNGFSFPSEGDLLIFEDDLYKGLRNNKDYLKILSDLRESYIWDNLIEKLVEDFKAGVLINNVSRKDMEQTIRQMAREDRNTRKLLGEQFLDFIGVYDVPKAAARVILSADNNDVVYLFVLGEYDKRDQRAKELQLRSFVVRALFQCKTIVGLATERYNPKGYSLDFSYSSYFEFTDEDRKNAYAISDDLDYFKNIKRPE
ncbi:MAG: hypothetical protein ACYC25_02970 [Paludibacter sp.]